MRREEHTFFARNKQVAASRSQRLSSFSLPPVAARRESPIEHCRKHMRSEPARMIGAGISGVAAPGSYLTRRAEGDQSRIEPSSVHASRLLK